jgi:16S rRNA (guanine527-N7)-methyltransferase
VNLRGGADGAAGCDTRSQAEGLPSLDRWLEQLLATPGLTAIGDPEEARRVHVDDALAAVPLLEDGPLVDVGSGGGSPGLPLAWARPDLDVVLLEASRRKCAFLERAARDFTNVSVVCARAEEHGRGPGRDAYATAVARALAPPPVAAEWCLPLVRPGGVLVLYAGAASPGLDRVAAALGAGGPEEVAAEDSERRRLLVFRKLEPTPERFPRRPGVARKRPLGG